MRTTFAVSIVSAAFAVYACSPDSVDNSPADAPDATALDAAQDAPTTPDSSEPVDAGKDSPSTTDATADAAEGCIRNPIADSNCSSQSRQAYLCPGDAGPGDAGPVCAFFTGLGELSLYCCEL